MADYNSNLKTWGSTGSAYPDGYSYLEGEQPVDAWDNYLTTNLVDDIKHLIALTNARIETDAGNAGEEPSPESAHLYGDTTNGRLRWYDTDSGVWRDVLFRDGDVMSGVLDMGGNAVSNVGEITDDSGNLIYDYSAGHIEQSILENSSLTVAGQSVALGGSTSLAHSDLSSIGSNDHHSRYADSEAISAINNDADHGSTASHDHSDLSGVGSSDHHSRYSDSEAQSAVDGASLGTVNATNTMSVPVYQSESDLPAGSQGDIAFVIDTGELYVEDGS